MSLKRQQVFLFCVCVYFVCLHLWLDEDKVIENKLSGLGFYQDPHQRGPQHILSITRYKKRRWYNKSCNLLSNDQRCKFGRNGDISWLLLFIYFFSNKTICLLFSRVAFGVLLRPGPSRDKLGSRREVRPPTYVTRRGPVFYIGDSMESCAVSEIANAKHLGRSSFRIQVFDLIDEFVGPEGGEQINCDANANFSPCRLQGVFVAASAKTTKLQFLALVLPIQPRCVIYLSVISHSHLQRVARVLRRRFYNSKQLYFAKTVCQCNAQTFV